MKSPGFVIKRLNGPDEDGLMYFRIEAVNDAVRATGEVYGTELGLSEFSRELARLPGEVESSAELRLASGSTVLELSARTVGRTGRIGLHVRLVEDANPVNSSGEFWVESHPVAIEQFGRQLAKVAAQQEKIAEVSK